jgi:transposase InsO family protein
VIHENVLARGFGVGTLNRAWAGDITYLWTQAGWLYLAVVLDIGSRRVIGWSLRPTLATELVVGALDMALGARPVEPGLICHSDRGSQYGSADIQAMIERYQMRGSMSRPLRGSSTRATVVHPRQGAGTTRWWRVSSPR